MFEINWKWNGMAICVFFSFLFRSSLPPYFIFLFIAAWENFFPFLLLPFHYLHSTWSNNLLIQPANQFFESIFFSLPPSLAPFFSPIFTRISAFPQSQSLTWWVNERRKIDVTIQISFNVHVVFGWLWVKFPPKKSTIKCCSGISVTCMHVNNVLWRRKKRNFPVFSFFFSNLIACQEHFADDKCQIFVSS